MKKLTLNPLALDKETIAKLDESQLQDIVGGNYLDPGSTGCGSGGSSCDGNSSTGCGSGGSNCDAASTGCGSGGSNCTSVA